MTLLIHFLGVNMLTWHAAPHIWAQVLSIGAGAGVFG